jgi:putative transposase
MAEKFRPLSELPKPQQRRRNMPHWESPGATYFLTFRLADSIPAGSRRELEIRASAWLRAHGCRDRPDLWLLSDEAQIEFRHALDENEERWLDRGEGACILRSADCRDPLIETMHHFDRVRYTLDAYVIMPNHVHALILPSAGWSLPAITATWKQYASLRINERLESGGALWQRETFDHIVRSWDKLEQFRSYIAANPARAKLSPGEFHLSRGSGIAAP